MFHQHVGTGDSDACELDPAIVDTIATHLLSNVTNVDAWHEIVCGGITKLNDKGLYAIALATDNELRKDDAMGGGMSGSSDPPFSRSDGRGVDDELI
jgi:hypothetical protein